MPQRSKFTIQDPNALQKGSFPGDTVKVQDPPASNMGTQDSFGDEKGLKAPPGARGEFVEGRPPGNIGVPINPHNLKVDEDNIHRRNQIPPMFLPAAQRIIAQNEEEIDNEDDARDSEEWKRLHDYERNLIPRPGVVGPGGPVHDEGGTATVQPGEPDVPSGQPEAQPHATPLPLDQLNNPDVAIPAIYSATGTVNPGMDTTQNLKFYNLDALVQNPQITQQMLDDLGFKVDVFSYNPERFKLPKLKARGYGQDTVWIYDPEEEHGSFKDTEYTRAWRVFHEVGHGITEDFMESKYGPSRREGRLGVESESMRGVPPKQVKVAVRGLTLAEAQRAIEWEDVAFRAQQMLLAMYGVQITPQEFAKEYNVNIGDAMFRTLTGDFGDPGVYGFVPSEQQVNVRNLLQFLQDEEAEIARETGRAPTQGINLEMWTPISDEDIRRALEQRMASRRHAYSIAPIPTRTPVKDERLLLQIPHDVQERYSDLNRRVYDYVKSLKLNGLDMYDFPADPPEKWIEEERGNVQVDWDDSLAWASYLGRLSHDDVADWIGLDSFDDARIADLAPNLHRLHALETGGEQPFSAWFRTRQPALTDEKLLSYVKDSAQTFPSDGLGKGYGGHWRRRNHEMVRQIATDAARARHERYLRQVAYGEYVRPNYRQHFDSISRAREERQSLKDIIPTLRSLPVEGGDRDTIDDFHREFDDLMNEGMHALDLYREPVSRDDRLNGDMQNVGLRWVPTRLIQGSIENIAYPDDHQLGMKVPKGGSSCAKCVHVSEDHTQCGETHFVKWNKGKDLPESADEYCCDFFKDAAQRRAVADVPLPVYKYGGAYFLVHESDRDRLSDLPMVRVEVYEIKPGSSIAKRAAVDWSAKSRALASAINEIKAGGEKEAVFIKYAREYGPGLRKAVQDYLFVTSAKRADGGEGPGTNTGDSTCSSFNEQSADNCDGCTFNVGTGGPEFGYGDGACLLTHLFLNAPADGFGRGDQNAYDPQHTPGTHNLQKPIRQPRTDPRLP